MRITEREMMLRQLSVGRNEIKPDKYETWYNLGIKYKELGEFDLGIECCQKIQERYPDSYEVKRLLDAINKEKERA